MAVDLFVFICLVVFWWVPVFWCFDYLVVVGLICMFALLGCLILLFCGL